MAADLLIRHCTLRISRRGGWSWGPDPRALVRTALSRLPSFVAERLAAAWPPADGDIHIDAPLRLRLQLHVDELRAWLPTTDGSTSDSALQAAFAQRLDDALRALVRQAAGREAERTDEAQPPAHRADTQALSAPPPAAPTSALLQVLLAWQRDEVLVDSLLAFGPEALQAWHDRLLQDAMPTSGTAASPTDEALAALVAEVLALQVPLPAGRRLQLLRRLVLRVEALRRLGIGPRHAGLAARLKGTGPLALPASSAEPAPGAAGWRQGPTEDDPIARGPAALLGRPARPVSLADRSIATAFELAAPSALPFLLLGPLARCGYLKALDAVAEAAGLAPDALPACATALARKVLEPPRRAWHRTPAAVASAQAFAGGVVVADEALAGLAHALAGQCAPLDAVVAHALTRGHTAGRSLVLQTADGWWVCDSEGLLPIAWAERIEVLFPRLAALGHELIAVPQAAVVPGLLQRLDAAGFQFVTDAAPARGEAWHDVRGSVPRAWRNETPDGPARVVAAALTHWGDESAALWQALGVERPALPLRSAPALERSLTLAAALALGTIAWTLWGHDGETSPLLALKHFGDLDAQVLFRADRVRVQLPLGRRFLDLKRAGLLDEVPGVPWFGGRPLQFVQG